MDNGAVTVTGNNIGDIDKIFSAPHREKMLLQSHHYHTALSQSIIIKTWYELHGLKTLRAWVRLEVTLENFQETVV